MQGHCLKERRCIVDVKNVGFKGLGLSLIATLALFSLSSFGSAPAYASGPGHDGVHEAQDVEDAEDVADVEDVGDAMHAAAVMADWQADLAEDIADADADLWEDMANFEEDLMEANAEGDFEEVAQLNAERMEFEDDHSERVM